MNRYPEIVRNGLKTLIQDVSKTPWLYTQNPAKDFTRKRKLDFETTLNFLIGMGGNNLNKEMLDYFGYTPQTASSSAFIQQRSKILPEALEFIFHEFTASFHRAKTYRGYHLLAVDGSDLVIPRNSSNMDAYYRPNQNSRGYNMLHFNAMYDLYSRLYLDAVIQKDEPDALIRMVERNVLSTSAILMADRGYEGYNTIAHIQKKGWKYLIRIKDAWGGILSGLEVPDTLEFDMPVQIFITRKRNKTTKPLLASDPQKYHWIASGTRFDYLNATGPLFYELNFRIVRFPTSNHNFETVITNLEPDEFTPSELKTLYQKRWGIETSFRELKYTVGLLNFHAKRPELIKQEIFSRLIMYNFTEMVTTYAVIHQDARKYRYKINFSAALHICRRFLSHNLKAFDIISLLSKFISPIRPGRSYPRFIKSKSAVSFSYRVG